MKLLVRSKVLNEKRPLWVSLPQSAAGRRRGRTRYPVLFLLDAENHFPLAQTLARFMANGPYNNWQIPELVIVGIPNTNRVRDLSFQASRKGYDGVDDPRLADSGGGAKFLQFLREEVIPLIEARYPVLPHRTLAGHSLGGLFVLHTAAFAPEAFQAYLSMDPSLWCDDQYLARSVGKTPSGSRLRPRSLYISQAGDFRLIPADRRRYRRAIAAFIDRLRTHRRVTHAQLRHQIFAAEDHVSVPLLSLYHGLLYIFGETRAKPRRANDFQAPRLRYRELSQRLGVRLEPPAQLLAHIARYRALRSKNAS